MGHNMGEGEGKGEGCEQDRGGCLRCCVDSITNGLWSMNQAYKVETLRRVEERANCIAGFPFFLVWFAVCLCPLLAGVAHQSPPSRRAYGLHLIFSEAREVENPCRVFGGVLG